MAVAAPQAPTQSQSTVDDLCAVHDLSSTTSYSILIVTAILSVRSLCQTELLALSLTCGLVNPNASSDRGH